MLKTILNKFKTKEKTQQREIKELLRENLSLVAVDIFYIDDPKLLIPPDQIVEYYKKFFDICRDKDIMERIKFLINKQVRLTIEAGKNGKIDDIGGVNINGMATVKDDFMNLANSYLKAVPQAEEFNRHKVI